MQVLSIIELNLGQGLNWPIVPPRPPAGGGGAGGALWAKV